MTESHFWEGTIRKMRATETEKFRAHLLRLDRDGRRLRFAHAVSDTFVSNYADRAAELGGVVYGYFEDGEMRAAAELRKIGASWAECAEAAFSVERNWQDRGIATELMGRVIRCARNRGVQHLYMSCLAENAKMQRIAKKHEARLHFEHGEVIGDIVPDLPSYLSVLEEILDDTGNYAMAVLDLRRRVSDRAA